MVSNKQILKESSVFVVQKHFYNSVDWQDVEPSPTEDKGRKLLAEHKAYNHGGWTFRLIRRSKIEELIL
jgi:hypothetical protein